MKSINYKGLLIILISSLVLLNQVIAQIPKGYKGKPFKDKYYRAGAQQVPGRVELAYYDLGGEGVAYHDSTPENEGAKLNHEVHDYGSHWRPGIPEYISYTKDWADFNHPNKVDPKVNQLYIGWQSDGEWTNYTIQVNKPGKYRIITVYGNQDNHSELWLNGTKACSLVLPENTGNWHYWTQATVGEIVFPKAGKNLLTLKYNRGSNLAYLDFLLVEPAKD